MNERAVKAIKEFLSAMDIDIAKAGMEKTPERVVKMYEYLFSGCGRDTSAIWGDIFQTETKGMVAVRDIPFYSMCEHHLVPFFGQVNIVYLPQEGRVAGFSKFTQLVELLSHKPQLQERLTHEIVTAVTQDLAALGAMVIVEAQQLCMTMRGELAQGSRTVTNEASGVLADNEALQKQAWLLLMKGENK